MATRWICEVCKVEMPWHSHQEHISGEEHAAAVDAMRKGETRKFSGTSSDEKQMQIDNQESHLSGKKHASRFAREQPKKVSQISDPQASNAKRSQRSITQQPKTQEDKNRWTCTICKDQMHINGREFHLSRAHQNEATSSTSNGGQEMATQVPKSHEMENKWTFTACNPEVMESDRDNHISGMRHAISTWSQSEYNRNAKSSSMTPTPPPSNKSTTEHVRQLVEGIKVPFVEAPQPQNQVVGNNWGKGKGKAKKKQGINQQMFSEAGTTLQSQQRISGANIQQTIPETASQPAFPPPTYTSPLDFFFLSFDGFPYDPSEQPETSFKRLNDDIGRYHRWERNSPGSPPTWDAYRKEVRNRYQAALTSEFNLHFGGFGAENNLTAWHSLCRAIRIQPLPTSCGLCREAVRDKHVNIVDLLHWKRKGESGRVSIFKTVSELSDYSYQNEKIYAKDQIGQGDILRYLLRELAKAHTGIGFKYLDY